MVQTPVQTDRLVGQRATLSASVSPSLTGAPVLPAYAVSCSVLTPSGTVVARGEAAPRREEHLPGAYSVELRDIEPPGVLEAMVYSDRPDIVLRAEGIPELRLRIDHVTGMPDQRQFYCQVR